MMQGSVLPMLLLLLVGSGALWIGQSPQLVRTNTPAQQETRRMLVEARQALINYSLAYSDNYRPTGAGIGHLPCPDLDPINDGVLTNDGPDPPCGRTSRQIGRLPRQTFTHGSPDAREPDADRLNKRIQFYAQRSHRDQQPWYVVSSAHVNNPFSHVVNTTTKGTLTVDSQDDIVAIIIAPGEALGDQSSSRPGDRPVFYLEGENADGDSDYSRRTDTSKNDQLIYITGKELAPLLEKRVMLLVVRWLHEFRRQHCQLESHCYPFAAMGTDCEAGRFSGALALLPGNCEQSLSTLGLIDSVRVERHWFVRNNWHQLIRYELSPECLTDYQQACSISIAYGHQRDDGISLVSVRPSTPDDD